MLIKDEKKAKQVYVLIVGCTAIIMTFSYAILQLLGMLSHHDALAYTRNCAVLGLMVDTAAILLIYKTDIFNFKFVFNLICIIIFSSMSC